jgi:mannosyltransferase
MWLAPLPSSFWVDEMGTEFVVQHGAGDPSLQVVPQVPESVYYILPRIAQQLFGASEIAYRVPSVLLMGIALGLIAGIARRLIHPAAGWFAAFACLLIRDFNYQAADARPYALGTCVASAALYFLIRCLDSGRWRDACFFGLCAALLWRVHLLFWPFYLVFAIYALVRLLRGQSKAGWLQVTLVASAVALSLIPVIAEALALGRQASSHVVVPIPSGSDLTKSLKPDFVLPFAAASALLARWLRWPGAPAVSFGSLVLVFAWWLVQPLSLFAYSRLSGNSVFLSRYLYIALPGIALTATVAAAAFVPARHWTQMATALGLGVLLFQGHWNHLLPAHHNSDWRNAARAINAELSEGGEPVICPSPFIEARPPVWRPDYPVASFLYSQVAAYPIRGTVYPFPFETSPEAERFASTLARGTLAGSGKFVVYGGDRAAKFWRSWFSGRPEFAGWRIRTLGSFGDVDAFVFERGPDAQ